MKSSSDFQSGIPIPALESLGGQLKERRLQAKLSQQQLAGMAGTSQAMIAQIESGKGNPTYKTLNRIAAVLDGEVRMFVSGGRYE